MKQQLFIFFFHIFIYIKNDDSLILPSNIETGRLSRFVTRIQETLDQALSNLPRTSKEVVESQKPPCVESNKNNSQCASTITQPKKTASRPFNNQVIIYLNLSLYKAY